MQVTNNRRRWGSVSMAFHWLVALLVLGMLILGNYMTGVEDLGRKFELFQLHKSFGFTVFCLASLRLAWRLTQTNPPLPGDLKPYEQVLAHSTHWGLYALLFLMPLAGWITTDTSPLDIDTEIFGLFVLPDPWPLNETLHGIAEEAHELMAWAFIGLIALHVSAAIKHDAILKDDTLRRMLPVKLRGGQGA